MSRDPKKVYRYLESFGKRFSYGHDLTFSGLMKVVYKAFLNKKLHFQSGNRKKSTKQFPYLKTKENQRQEIFARPLPISYRSYNSSQLMRY